MRADLAGDIDPRPLRERFDGRLVYSLRSADRGGEARDPAGERRRRLLAAARDYDVVDLEHERDLDPEVLERSRPSAAGSPGTARPRGSASSGPGSSAWRKLSARLYLLAPAAATVADGLAPSLLASWHGPT